MKKSMILFCAIFSLTMSSAAQAVAPTAMYDNFSASLINPAKWFGNESDDDRANLENLRHIVGNATLGNRLRLYGRGYGAGGFSFGTRYGSNNSKFRNPNPITAIKASVWVNSVAATGCPSNPNDATRISARLGGTFFNASANPIPGDETYDVVAQISAQRASNSTDAPNVLRVRSGVHLCQDLDCFNASSALAEMGTVNVGQKVTLSMEWDKANKRFIFRRDMLAPVYLVSERKPFSLRNG